jgi:DNA-directed RNA polymerase subunit RPC12/RpoP
MEKIKMLGGWQWSYECEACGKPHWIMKTHHGLYCPEKGFLKSAQQRPTPVAADDATAEHYGQTSTDNYIYSDEVSGAKPRHR